MLYFRIVVVMLCGFFCVANVVLADCIGDEISSGFCWPTEGDDLLLGWHGYNEDFSNSGLHLAQDIGAAEGDDVYAIADGVVLHNRTDVSCFGGFTSNDTCIDGGALIIKHRNSSGNFFTAQYGHVKNISVGDKVLKGQKIAEIGPYTNGTVHLHFAIRYPFNDDGKRWSGYGTSDMGFVNPMTFMDEYNPAELGVLLTPQELCYNDSCDINYQTFSNGDKVGWYPQGYCTSATDWFTLEKIDGEYQLGYPLTFHDVCICR